MELEQVFNVVRDEQACSFCDGEIQTGQFFVFDHEGGIRHLACWPIWGEILPKGMGKLEAQFQCAIENKGHKRCFAQCASCRQWFGSYAEEEGLDCEDRVVERSRGVVELWHGIV